MKLEFVQKNEIDGEKNAFYENQVRNNVKKYWFDLLIEEKETVSFGFDAIEIFKIQQYMVNFHVCAEKEKATGKIEAFLVFNQFLGDNIRQLQALIFKNIPHQDVPENWVNSSKAFNFFKDLNEFEVLAFLEEKVYEITLNAYLFYINKAKKKESMKTEKTGN
jgi:hypothetical protein